MKKILTLAVALLACATTFAQSKGDMAIGGTLGFDLGNTSSKAKVLSTGTTSSSSAGNGSFYITPGFSYFVIDNLSVNLLLNYEFENSGLGNENTFALYPSCSYYIAIADNFYYTPTAYLGFEFSDPFFFNMGIEVGRFEFRPFDKLAFTFSLGDLAFRTYSKKNTTLDYKTSGSSIQFGVNEGSLFGVKYYL